MSVHVYRRPGEGTGKLYFKYRDENGKSVRRSSGTANPEEAYQLARQLQADLERRKNNANALRYQETLVDYVNSRGKPNTRRVWRNMARRWDELEVDGRRLRDLYLPEITVEHVKAHVQRRRKQRVTDGTIRGELGFLSGLFTYAGVPPGANPARLFEKRSLRPVAQVERFLTHEEEATLLAACPYEPWSRMIVFAIETGLRKSEQIGLLRGQVNLVKREVTLGRETKAGRGRVVPLSQRALSVLEGQLPDDPREVVFRNLQGRGWVTIETWWDKVRNRSGIFCRWHDLRHTFASRWLQDGGEITVLQKVLGHSTLELTMRYAHLVTENLHAETRRLDEVRRLRRLDAA
jgi:integrase/recombinase XerD